MNRYMPCKVKFSWYSSRKVEKGFLEPNNRWKPCLGVRGEVPTGIDDVVDVEINEGDEDEDEGQDEDMDEERMRMRMRMMGKTRKTVMKKRVFVQWVVRAIRLLRSMLRWN